MKPYQHIRAVVCAFLFFPFLASAQFGMPGMGGSSDDGSKWLGINPAICLAPLPFFDDYDNGFVVLRDGSRLDGKINIKDYEKAGEKINITTKDGKKYKLYTYSIKYFGLNINIPRNRSPLNLYDWKNEKKKATKGPERGFVVLMSGDTLDGKIQIEGRSSESPRAEGNYFAIETLTFTDKAGKATEYTRDKIKAFGRILPWELSPPEMWQWQKGVAFGKRKSLFQPGFILMNDGKRIEGEMQLVVKNPMSTKKGNENDMMGGKTVESKIFSDLVDEIYVKRDGKDEKVSTDDVYAFGIAGMTINTLTNKGARLYQREEMNFHEGSVTTRDGKKVEGYVALRPYDNNYYGVYYAAKPDDPIQIIPVNEITALTQDVSLVEAFGEEASAPKANTNLNGYIVQNDGSRFEGTVKLVGDNGWWTKSIEFTDKQGYVSKFGDPDPAISCFVVNNVLYVQNEDVFVKADMMAAPLALYNSPYPPKKGSGFEKFAMSMASMMVGEAVGMAMADAQRGGLDMSGVEIDGQAAGGNAAPIPMYQKDGSVVGYIQRTNAQNIIGSSVSGMMFKQLEESAKKTARKEGPKKDDKSLVIYNAVTRENRQADDLAFEVFLEGCLDYYGLAKAEQKKLTEDNKAAIEFLNKCLTKNKK